jgi:CRISPR/Cas system CSM-associated protein Csm3 (group 7 of RAMP superfamily)
MTAGPLRARMTLELELFADGPVLVGDGEEPWQRDARKALLGATRDHHVDDVRAADIVFCHDGPRVRVSPERARQLREDRRGKTSAGGAGQIHIPGSSLKGRFRSHAEWILRLLLDPEAVCDPFATNGGCFVSHREDPSGRRRLSAGQAYSQSCPACRTFGNCFLASPVRIEDARPLPGPRAGAGGGQAGLARRDGIAIDRFTGGVAGSAKFDYQVAERVAFVTRLRWRRFEPWQVGLLAYVLHDLEDGVIGIGHGWSKGLGRMRIRKAVVELAVLRNRTSPPQGPPDVQLLRRDYSQGSDVCEGTGRPLWHPLSEDLWKGIARSLRQLRQREEGPLEIAWRGEFPDYKSLRKFLKPFRNAFSSGNDHDFITWYAAKVPQRRSAAREDG